MTSLLSKKINLRVNDYPVILQDNLSLTNLQNHKIKKAGFLAKLTIKRLPDETVFWSKNCELKYIDNALLKNKIFPILDTKTGADTMYGTSAFLFYQEGKLCKFIFQIIRNEIMAKLCLERFEQAIKGVIGNHSSADTQKKFWVNSGEQLIIEYPDEHSNNGYIHFGLA